VTVVITILSRQELVGVDPGLEARAGRDEFALGRLDGVGFEPSGEGFGPSDLVSISWLTS
jgi:hypothetical protein